MDFHNFLSMKPVTLLDLAKQNAILFYGQVYQLTKDLQSHFGFLHLVSQNNLLVDCIVVTNAFASP